MTKPQVKLVLNDPDTVTKCTNVEVWVYRIHGLVGVRYVQLIVPIPTGRKHYELSFIEDTLKKIDFADEWVLQD